MSALGRVDDQLMSPSALSSKLSLPLIVNHADGTVKTPTRSFGLESPDKPSVFRHLDLHCQLCIGMAKVAAQLGGPSDAALAKAEVASQMRDVVDQWLATLPTEYAQNNPDTRWDIEHDYVVTQRRYLHLIGHMELFNNTATRCANQEDESHSLPQRVSVQEVLKGGLSLLGQVRSAKTTTMPQDFLNSLLAHLLPPPQLAEPPQNIIDAFERFMHSALLDLDKDNRRDDFNAFL